MKLVRAAARAVSTILAPVQGCEIVSKRYPDADDSLSEITAIRLKRQALFLFSITYFHNLTLVNFSLPGGMFRGGKRGQASVRGNIGGGAEAAEAAVDGGAPSGEEIGLAGEGQADDLRQAGGGAGADDVGPGAEDLAAEGG
jgi:hypothetical protein